MKAVLTKPVKKDTKQKTEEKQSRLHDTRSEYGDQENY